MIYDQEATTRTVKLGPPDPRRENTLRHLSAGWMPAHPAALVAVRSVIEAPTLDRAALSAQVKSDPGLFVFAARSLPQVKAEADAPMDLFAALQGLEDEQLRKLFDVREPQISSHRIADISRPLALRQQFSLLAARSAEKLAAKCELSSGTAFTAASLRQLGLNLIAWNYPRIYSRQVSSSRADPAAIDAELVKMLGLTPAEIGARFAAAWGLHPDVRALIAARRGPARSEQLQGAPDMERILRISELFAQRKDPRHFPHAEEQWQAERAGIEAHFPETVFEEIEEEVRGDLKVFSEVSAEFFSVRPHRADGADSASERARLFAGHNAYFARSPVELQRLLLPVYERVEPKKVSIEAVRALVEQVIPLCGFERGCLFLARSSRARLTPVLRIGNRPLAEYAAFLDEPDNGVDVSTESSVPLSGEGIGITGNRTAHVSSALDHPAAIGFLYLELAAEEARPAADALLVFRLLRSALNHALGALPG